jgi:hypothetical protein
VSCEIKSLNGHFLILIIFKNSRGRYGYVDPDGLKREYNYETGILCDPSKRDLEEEEEELETILANGARPNSAASKAKPKPAQQYYRN